ncbi:MAG: hypothetical protein CMH23_07010 [Methylophaga sp.]|uniref:hypothetical protein n=1 Tax=Methylophaga sp. TaxID=2024840 RepID=UPI000C911A0C|nr:hypothetical protein [Methylophaga sp.]MBN46208.1 hypothetical protein [Methylophaga sp.]QDP56594.1 MAG: hypothetical protein GOVbin2380_29 [Prokaryotic dsDNA virus sp.]|tara:strand:- start:6500 stop:7261 length:762 start_codon:yes stop_codon:yes gene_type:complete
MKRQIIKLEGASFTEPGLPVLDVTDEEIEIASMPGLVAWFDPQTKFIRANSPVGMNDRVNGYILKEFSSDASDIGAYLNGQQAVQMVSAQANGYTIEDLSLHPAGSYTKIAVVQFDSLGGMDIISATGTVARFRLGSASGELEVIHGGTTRQTANGVVAIDTPYIVMVGYDANLGRAKVFVNGGEVALDNASISAPAITDDLSFGLAKTIGSFFNGKMGYGFVFEADYSLAAYQSYFDRIHAILATKYGITLA